MAVIYENVREELDTGDIVLFSGKGGISEWIKGFTRSKWSHVGMVIKDKAWDMVLLWESTTLSNIDDLETGRKKKGVQLVALSERIDNYTGEVSVRRLITEKTPQMVEALKDLRNEIKERSYEESMIELIKSAYDGPLGQNTQDLSSLFCSELVAEAYMRMGLLPVGTLPSNEYTPKDFSSERNLQLLKEAKLGNEILVTTKKA